MKKLLLPIAILGIASSALAQTAFNGTYTFTGTTGTNNPFSYNGTDIANLTEGGLSRSNLPVSSSAGNFRSTGFALDPVVGSLTGSYDPAEFFEFSLTAGSGFTLSMSNITFGLGRSGTGPRSWAWASSVDNFAAFTGNYSSLGTSGLFSTNVSATNPAGALFWLTDSSATTGTNIVLDLSGASFQNLTSITLRLYGWNAEGTAGTAGLQGPMSFSGSLLNTNPVTGGTYWAADPAGGGSGTWTSVGTTWATNAGGAGAGQTQSSATLIFADTAGTVTVSGGVTVSNGMTFQTTGYDVQGSTITLAGNSAANNNITADTGVTTTVSSELAGTTGMTKGGAGTLILSGSNSFTGNAVISGGTLQISNDFALGNAANNLANNGTLKTTATIALDAGRDLSGSGTYDIANTTTLTVNGNINNAATTLANTGTLDLQGATRSLGSIAFNAPGTINAVGAINATGLTAPGVISGTATINPDIVFTTGDKTLNVAAGGTVDLNGALSGNTNRILKTGSGTLILSAANNLGGLRVGASAATPTDGGTVILENNVIGTQAQAIQLNYGTLQAASNLVFSNGISIGGRTGASAVLAGSDMEFQGTNSFFRAGGTSGEMRLDVNNTTTFSSGFAATSGAGTSTGVTFGGTGTLIIGGDSSAFTDSLTLGSGLTAVRLASSNALAGSTIVSGADKLQFAATAINVAGVTGNQNLSLQTVDPAPQAVALTMTTTGTITNSGVVSGLGSFNKAGSGTVVLAGNNTYTGTTAVIGGALIINGDQFLATGVLSAASGTKLGGSGKIGGAVAVSGTLAPGSSIESLAMGALSFSTGSTFAVELDSSVATSVGADLVIASGNLSLESPGTITLTLNDIAATPIAFAEGTTFSLINYSGTWNSGLFTLDAGTLANGATFAFGLNTWTIDYNAVSGGVNFMDDQTPGSFVNIQVVPEPSTYALIALSGVALAGYATRRRRRAGR